MTPEQQPLIYEKDGKYFQEIQVKWADATLEERAKWVCYQQDHIKRLVEIDPITKQPKT